MKQIPLSNGKGIATVDDEDYPALIKYKWSLLTTGYAFRTQQLSWNPITKKQTRKTVLMHKVVMGNPEEGVDHRDHNRLNNQKDNLRLATQLQNMHNVSKPKVNSPSSSKYKGVQKSLRSKTPTWFARIRINGTLKHIGTYPTEAAAAIAYNEKAIEYFGEFACLNQLPE